MLALPSPPARGYPLPATCPPWLFVAGTWGDVLAGLGNAEHVLRETGVLSASVVYYGPDPGIAEFIRLQPWVRGVVDLRSSGPVTGLPTDPARRRKWLPGLLCDTDLRWEDVWPCHVDFSLTERQTVYRPERVRVPADLLHWATVLRAAHPGRVVLLQPRSEASCAWSGHWPFWSEAVAELLERDVTLLLVGKGYDPHCFGAHPRLINLVDRTPGVPHLFALAEVVDQTVTTSSGLALWCASRGLPAIACCNRTHNRPGHFFTRFIESEAVTLINHWEPLEAFRAALEHG